MNNKSICSHNPILMTVLTVLTFIAIILHMLSHFIPILITNESTRQMIEPWLHNPVIVAAAWSFLLVMAYHFWKDRKMHRELHRLQEKLERLSPPVERQISPCEKKTTAFLDEHKGFPVNRMWDLVSKVESGVTLNKIEKDFAVVCIMQCHLRHKEFNFWIDDSIFYPVFKSHSVQKPD